MQTGCRYFNGYKPCGLSQSCDSQCPSLDIPKNRILVIHLEAIGAVLRATSILLAVKQKFQSSHITWVTQKPANELLKNNPYIDRVLTTEVSDLLVLQALEFDFAFVIDKSLKAMGVLQNTTADMVYGFTHDKTTGAILPATDSAQELWEIGLSDLKKFFENNKPETQLIAESLELTYQRDPYILKLTSEELSEAQERKQKWLKNKKAIVGINTGCSATIPNKKLSIQNHRELILKIQSQFTDSVQVVLLGGREDSERNLEIAENLPVILSPTDQGLRDGAISVQACDLVITGDSLGMHMAIALEKYVIAWFGPTCAHEIDLYGRGVHIITKANCAPCWKRTCQKNPMCYDLVQLDEIIFSVEKGLKWLKECSSSKQHSSEIYY